jgi:TonB family protein
VRMLDQTRTTSSSSTATPIRLVMVLLTVAVLTVTRGALAQPVPTAESSTIVAPRLRADPGVEYPQEALREHFTEAVSVELVLDIDADGTVRNAVVTDPRGHGFDEAALDAARHLVFEPATRDGRPIPAKIRFRYDFALPPPRLVGRVATQASDRPIEGAAVTVRDASGAGPEGSPGLFLA